MAIELTTASPETISSIRASLSSANSDYYTVDESSNVIITSVPSGTTSADIRLESADNINIQGRDEVTLGREGGDINIDGGDGGPAGDGNNAGSGGDINIRAGLGGNASGGTLGVETGGIGGLINITAGNGGEVYVQSGTPPFGYNEGGEGGYVYIASGNGASANTGTEYLVAKAGGRIEIQAGNAGNNDSTPSAGALGGEVLITAGDSTNDGAGANVVITSGRGIGGGGSSASGTIQLKVPIGISGNYNTWTLSQDGFITFPGGSKLLLRGAGPNSSVGDVGDLQGMIAFSSDYFYYCTADYVDGLSDIWKRVQLDSTPW